MGVSGVGPQDYSVGDTAATPSADPQAAAPPQLGSRFAGDSTLVAVAAGTQQLEIGATGAAVRSVQSALKALNYDKVGTPDGQFGPGTRAALALFQRDAGLTASGALDSATLVALDGWCTARENEETATTAPVSPGADPQASAGAAALAVAQSYVTENIRSGDPHPSPTHTDHTKDGPAIQHFTGGNPEPWCADFVKTCFAESGHPLPAYQRSTPIKYVPAMASMLSQDFFTAKDDTPQPGDVIFFGKCNPSKNDFGGLKHVGIVESVDADGTIHTIEGNTGDGKSADGGALLRKTHNASDGWVAGFARL